MSHRRPDSATPGGREARLSLARSSPQALPPAPRAPPSSRTLSACCRPSTPSPPFPGGQQAQRHPSGLGLSARLRVGRVLVLVSSESGVLRTGVCVGPGRPPCPHPGLGVSSTRPWAGRRSSFRQLLFSRFPFMDCAARVHARNNSIHEPFKLTFTSGVSLWSKFLFFFGPWKPEPEFPKISLLQPPVYSCFKIYSNTLGADSMPGPGRSWALRWVSSPAPASGLPEGAAPGHTLSPPEAAWGGGCPHQAPRAAERNGDTQEPRPGRQGGQCPANADPSRACSLQGPWHCPGPEMGRNNRPACLGAHSTLSRPTDRVCARLVPEGTGQCPAGEDAAAA